MAIIADMLPQLQIDPEFLKGIQENGGVLVFGAVVLLALVFLYGRTRILMEAQESQHERTMDMARQAAFTEARKEVSLAYERLVGTLQNDKDKLEERVAYLERRMRELESANAQQERDHQRALHEKDQKIQSLSTENNSLTVRVERLETQVHQLQNEQKFQVALAQELETHLRSLDVGTEEIKTIRRAVEERLKKGGN